VVESHLNGDPADDDVHDSAPVFADGLVVYPDRVAHHVGRDDRELAAFGPRLRSELRVGGVCGKSLPTDEHTLGLLDDGPGIQRRLQLGGQFGLLFAKQHAGDEQRGQIGECEQRKFGLSRPGAAVFRQHRHHAHCVLVIGDGAGQHGPDPAGDGVLAERRPPVVLRQVFGPDQFLVLEGRDAGTFLVANLQFLQVAHAVVGYRGVQQVVIYIGQHQAGAIHGEDRVSGLDDVVHRVLHPHLTEAQFAELVQRVAHIVYRDAHLPAPASSLASA